MASCIERASQPVGVRLQICYDNRGQWSVHGLPPQPTRNLPSLSAALDHARRQCGAAPATIELMIDGFYAVVHQEEGWPRQLVGPPVTASLPPGNGRAGSSGPFARLRQWLGVAA
jgi:hypothetical protein